MYLTVTELATYMSRSTAGVSDFDTETTDLLEDQIFPAMKALIDQHTRRTFEAATATARTFHAIKDVGYGSHTPVMQNGGDWYEHYEKLRTLWLDMDLCAITSVVNGDGTTITTAQYATVPANETPYNRIVLLPSGGIGWTFDDDPEGAIVVTGKWAYSVTAPEHVKLACLRFAKHLYRQRDDDDSGADQPRVSPDGTWIFPTVIPKDVLSFLEPLRKKM